MYREKTPLSSGAAGTLGRYNVRESTFVKRRTKRGEETREKIQENTKEKKAEK
jgi:hypothetical protein